MEDDLQILKVKYLSNHLLHPTQILNLCWITKLYCTNPLNEDDLQWTTTSSGRPPLMEDDLEILKVKYLRNHLLDPTQILNLCLDDQTILYKSFK